MLVIAAHELLHAAGLIAHTDDDLMIDHPNVNFGSKANDDKIIITGPKGKGQSLPPLYLTGKTLVLTQAAVGPEREVIPSAPGAATETREARDSDTVATLAGQLAQSQYRQEAAQLNQVIQDSAKVLAQVDELQKQATSSRLAFLESQRQRAFGADVQEVIERLHAREAELESAMAQVERLVARKDSHLRIEADQLVFAPLEASSRSASADALADRIAERHGGCASG